MRSSFLVCALSVLLIGFCSSAQAQDQAYMFSGSVNLETLDLTTGASVSVINARSGGMNHCEALTWNEDAQQLWVAEYGATNARIGILDPFTATFTPRRLTALPGWWQGITWNRAAQRFYLVRQEISGQSFLHVYNPATGSLAQVGGMPNAPFPTALDSDASGTLWLATAQSNLFMVDRTNASTTLVATFPFTIEGIGVHQATGRLYATAAIQLTMYLMEIEPTVPSWRIIRQLVGGGGSELDLVDGTCPGGFQAFGSGCQGFGGFIPQLAGEGCLGASGNISLRFSRGRTGSVGALLFGAVPGNLPLGNGCSLLVSPLLPSPILPVQLIGPAGFGNGFANIPISIPPGVVVAPFVMQGLFLDAGAPGGFSMTNGLAVLAP
ncbi:MAG: hypothetical protein IPN34_21470 [Planctomycetes bacterium]|nr:hypothetical protein [Planctomycetota bacterium]